jgi:hypothetical protein
MCRVQPLFSIADRRKDVGWQIVLFGMHRSLLALRWSEGFCPDYRSGIQTCHAFKAKIRYK